MTHTTPHTVYLQDGTLCNFRKRMWRRALPLLTLLRTVSDPRKKRGRRHELSLILFLLFAGMTTGCTTLKDCHLWALHNRKFLRRYFPLLHGIPDPTTISYLLQKLSPTEVEEAYCLFLRVLGLEMGDVFSFDGKTMRGVTGEKTIRHILSLFSHLTHTVLSQSGVSKKENEIPAFRRLLKRMHGRVKGFLFVADALHAQVDTAVAIVEAKADYLLVIKGNQRDFFLDVTQAFSIQKDLPGTNYKAWGIQQEQYTEEQQSRKRAITTTVTLTHDRQLCAYLTEEHGFSGLQSVGILKRLGTRQSKDGTIVLIDETICFVSSRNLSGKQALRLLRTHWCIENNLHWVKDFVFLEDRQTLRRGNAPQIMSFLRSIVISFCNLLQFQSISDALHNFQKSKSLHYQFLRMAAIC